VGANNTPIISHKELREIDLGEWEGLSFADVVRRFPNEFKSRGADIGYYRTPGGESFADCSKRVVGALHEIMKNSRGNILIAGHAGVNRLFLCHVLGMPLTNIFRLVQDYGCLNIIQYSSSGYQVKLINLK
jgi:probable phosphoglycerate mutase